MTTVLFLVGPWHQERHDVPDDLPAIYNVMPPIGIDVFLGDAPEPEPVRYLLRQPRHGGAPFYTAPGWRPA